MSEGKTSDVPGSGFVCPRCGFEQPAAAECARCGVVFTKLRAEGRRAAVPPPVPPPGQAAAAPETQGSGRFLGWLIMILLVVAAVAVFPRNRPAPPPEPAAALTAMAEASPAPAPPPAAEPSQAAPASPASPELAVAEPVSAPEPVEDAGLSTPVRMPLYWYDGAQGYRQAMDEANADGRVVAVYFYTDWCPYCRRLDRDLLQTPQVQDYFRYVVKVKINPESGAAEQELSDRYGVTGYPSFFIETPATGEVRRVNAFTREDGQPRIRTPDEFLGLCRRAAG